MNRAGLNFKLIIVLVYGYNVLQENSTVTKSARKAGASKHKLEK